MIFSNYVTEKYEIILFPCLKSTHFFLIALDTRSKSFNLYDTLPNYFKFKEKTKMLTNLKDNFLRILNQKNPDHHIEPSTYKCQIAECEPQGNYFDCGPAISFIAEMLIKGENVQHFDIKDDRTYDTIGTYHFYRRNLQLLVLNASIAVHDLCIICEQTSDTDDNTYNHNWIGCDICERWFHTKCIIETFPHTSYRDLISNTKYICTLCEKFKLVNK